MFWRKKEAAGSAFLQAEKLSSPKHIEELVGRHLVVALKKDPDWVWQLQNVLRQRTEGKRMFDFRVFDKTQVQQRKVEVTNWATFDQYPELILYQGWFDKDSMEVHLEDNKK